MKIKPQTFKNLFNGKTKKGNILEKRSVKKFKKEVGQDKVQQIKRIIESEYIISDSLIGLYVIVWYDDHLGEHQQSIIDMVIPRAIYNKIK